MIDTQLKFIADEFIRSLQSMPQVIEYLDALNKYENDEIITSLMENYNQLSIDFQKKQYDGTLTQADIAELRKLAAEIQNNKLYKELIKKQNNLKELLQECNDIVSNEISMDFAKLAAPSSCCS
ncbi:YlbF family regulator [Melioribacteraceae bacterium 4301-Me]|uniref:YlbF family regulator n=1 Tax=Pyranulibacter aquaticus TaxID=3163344 RepID=UPI00359982CE